MDFFAATAVSSTALASVLASSLIVSVMPLFFRELLYSVIRVTCTAPTHIRPKLMAARLIQTMLANGQYALPALADYESYKRFCGLMMKHHRVQIAPVDRRARFWFKERDSGALAKSATPARTMTNYWLAVSSDPRMSPSRVICLIG